MLARRRRGGLPHLRDELPDESADQGFRSPPSKSPRDDEPLIHHARGSDPATATDVESRVPTAQQHPRMLGRQKLLIGAVPRK
jgi:hypothetical protein